MNNLPIYVNYLNNSQLIEFHDSAFEETNFDCYYLLKALKLVNYDLFMRIAEISTNSKHGHKAAFHKTVIEYSNWGFDFNHSEDKGGKLLPLIINYFKSVGIDQL